MSDITIDFVTQETTIDFVQQQITLSFPNTVPGIGVPPGGDVGDVLTKTGSGDYAIRRYTLGRETVGKDGALICTEPGRRRVKFITVD
jgi:hypothetical protein